MKFRVVVKDFTEGLSAALAVATKGIVRDSPSALLITLVAEKNQILALANGGRMGIKTYISDQHGCNDLKYECEKEGHCTVRALDLKATLGSFADEEEIWIELRKCSNVKDLDNQANGNDASSADRDSSLELIFSFADDEDQFQTMPCYRETLATPQYVSDLLETKKVSDSLQVRRDIFVSAANRVFFARGFEDQREMYMYWIIAAKPDEIRFATGSGVRFAILDLAGNDLTKGKDTFRILLPNAQTPAILNTLECAVDEFVQFYPDDKYLIIKGNTFEAFIAQYEADMQWPDVNRFLDRQSSYKFTSQIKNWANVVRGISATYNEDLKKQHDFHYAELDVDPDHDKFIQTKTEGIMRSKRKLIIDDLQLSDETISSIAVSCVSQYLAEAVKNATNTEDYVQVEIEDTRTPIILRYHAASGVDGGDFWSDKNPSGIREKYTMFFAPRKRRS